MSCSFCYPEKSFSLFERHLSLKTRSLFSLCRVSRFKPQPPFVPLCQHRCADAACRRLPLISIFNNSSAFLVLLHIWSFHYGRCGSCPPQRPLFDVSQHRLYVKVLLSYLRLPKPPPEAPPLGALLCEPPPKLPPVLRPPPKLLPELRMLLVDGLLVRGAENPLLRCVLGNERVVCCMLRPLPNEGCSVWRCVCGRCGVKVELGLAVMLLRRVPNWLCIVPLGCVTVVRVLLSRLPKPVLVRLFCGALVLPGKLPLRLPKLPLRPAALLFVPSPGWRLPKLVRRPCPKSPRLNPSRMPTNFPPGRGPKSLPLYHERPPFILQEWPPRYSTNTRGRS